VGGSPRYLRRAVGQTLIGLLVVVAIILTLTVVYMGGGSRGGDSKGPKTVPGRAQDQAYGVHCMNNLNQVRQALQIAQMELDAYPKSLRDLNLQPEMLRCPVGGEPYQYDPTTGKVRCLHPGHEKH
jgi:hypothetical protein